MDYPFPCQPRRVDLKAYTVYHQRLAGPTSDMPETGCWPLSHRAGMILPFQTFASHVAFHRDEASRRPLAARYTIMDSGIDTARHWEGIADRWTRTGYNNPVLANHKRAVYLDLIERWIEATPRHVLKTDLFAEALTDEEFFSALPWRESILGIDVSQGIVSRARKAVTARGEASRGWVACDVRSLPFGSCTFDLVVSDSTLDHLATTQEIEGALSELARILSPGGTMVLTIDNPHNITYPPLWLVRLWMRLGLAPYFIGATLNRGQIAAALARFGLRIDEETAILHYPHPDGVVRATESMLRRLGRGRLDRPIQHTFTRLERLQHSRIRYRTGRYLAIKATKAGTV